MGPPNGDESNYPRVDMAHLGAKLEPDRSHPRYLITESGMRYRFVVSSRAQFALPRSNDSLPFPTQGLIERG